MTQTRAPREIRVRTCIATRERKPDIELLRVVLDPRDPTRLLADPGRRLPGRGAWITPDVTALELAEQRRAFGRAFRVSGT
ncbi:MAG TPA: YlxR family protein, partial [Corynebacterium sp.]|nr:YlxR family protein [Corynebacterium sp.]